MKIGPRQIPVTRISTSNRERIVVRGKDLCLELIGHVSFTDYFWFLCLGRMPAEKQRKIIDAALVSIAEHGLVPSVVATRMTLAAGPDAIQGAVAAGLLGCGSVVLGSAESSGRFLQGVVETARSQGIDIASSARQAVQDLKQTRRQVPGYGHPLHRGGDPRAGRLLEVARELEVAGEHVAAAIAVEQMIPEVFGKALPLNVSGALPAALLDAGYPIEGMKGIPLLARTAGLIAHVIEELQEPSGFALSYQAAREAMYEGEVPEGFAPLKE